MGRVNIGRWRYTSSCFTPKPPAFYQKRVWTNTFQALAFKTTDELLNNGFLRHDCPYFPVCFC